MAKPYKIYDGENRVRGNIKFNDDHSGIYLSFGNKDNLLSDFKSLINKFLREKNMKIVSGFASNTGHYNNKLYKKAPKCFDVFRKYRNPRTQKLEFKKLK